MNNITFNFEKKPIQKKSKVSYLMWGFLGLILLGVLFFSCDNSNNPVALNEDPIDNHIITVAKHGNEHNGNHNNQRVFHDEKPGARSPNPPAPIAPSNMSAILTDGIYIDLYWNDNSVNEKFFKIERQIENGEFEFLINVEANITNFTDTVRTNNTYTYHVRSENRSGISYWITSNPVFVPAPPLIGITFDGSGNNYIVIPDADILSPQSYTVELWVKQPPLFPNNIGHPGSVGRNMYIFKDNGVNSHNEYNFMENPNAPSSYGAGLYSWTDFGLFETDDKHPVPNVWTHLAACFDTDLNKLEIFVGGVSVGQTTITHEIQNTPGNLYLGYHPGDPTYNALTGTMDEIRISDFARYTSDFIPSRRFETDSGTIALYHFDGYGGDDRVVFDSSGNGNHGILYGATRN